MMDFIREVPRLKASLSFTLPDGWRGDVIDVSAKGLRIQCLALLESNTQVSGNLRLPSGREIALEGTVIWSHPPESDQFQTAEVGIELREPPREYLEAVAELFAAD